MLAAFSQDQTRLLTHTRNAAFLWDRRWAKPLRVLPHESMVGNGFVQKDAMVVTGGGENGAKIWRAGPSDVTRRADDRILEFEVRTATRLDDSGLVQPIDLYNWQRMKKVPSQ